MSPSTISPISIASASGERKRVAIVIERKFRKREKKTGREEIFKEKIVSAASAADSVLFMGEKRKKT